MPSTEEEGSTSIKTSSTTFVTDSTITKLPLPYAIEDDIVVQQQAITDFLAKPYLIGTYTYSTSNSTNDYILSMQSIVSYLQSISSWSNKISGYQLVRGKAVITVNLNANPFQSGKLLLHYLPCYVQINSADPSYDARHNINITTKRQQPSVEIDCRDSGGILEIPYIAPSNWCDIKTGSYDWGSFAVTALTPLRTGASGETAAFVTVYMHFEDFELAAPIVPQSSVSKKRYKARVIPKSETAAMNSGLISSGLMAASNIAESFSHVPLLSDIATPLAWVLRGSSGVASFFGWSKSNIDQPPHSVARQQQHYGANSDGIDTGYSLALCHDNRLGPAFDCSVTDEDEMSLKYLLSVSAPISYGTWSNASTVGTSLYNISVSPQGLYASGSKVVSTHTVNYACGAPIYYLSNLYDLYRGSINMTIKFAKTDYHTGRVQLTFTPTSSVSVVPTVSTAILSLREIIDLRCGSEFTFKLPYLLNRDYAASNEAIGRVDLLVLNELRNPENAASSIDYIIYFSGGDDFEFQVPADSPMLPFSPQMDCRELANSNIGNTVIPKANLKHAQRCIGEYSSSAKQLVSRYGAINQTSYTSGNSGLTTSFYPFYNTIVSMNSSTGAAQGSNQSSDTLSCIAQMYAFYRGGMNAMIIPAVQGIVGASVELFNFNSTTITASGNPKILPTSALNWYIPGNGQNFNGTAITDHLVSPLTFEVPFYSRFKMSVVVNSSTTNIARPDPSNPNYGLSMCSNTSGAFTTSTILRSARDDFCFHFFLGCPPIVTSYV